MMECVALSPIRFSIWSTDWSLIRTNLFVNAHPKANIGRLLQYVHWQMRHSKALEDNNNIEEVDVGPASDYTFFQGCRELDLETLLEDIETDGKGIIKLQLERRKNHSGTAYNLDYDMEHEFQGLNLHVNVNTLSVDKMTSELKYVPVTVTVGRLKKLALTLLTDYERDSSRRSICKLKHDHTVEDLVGLSVKGKKENIRFEDEKDSELYEDMSISELLGIDFAPQSNSFFSLMFRARHDQSCLDAEENITIEFVSDAKLSMNQMVVTPRTTVEQVKEFICSTYTHALRLSPTDVKLVYKGQLIHRLDLAGNPSKIMEYIKESQDAKLHVYISEEYTEPGPGFWSELFHNPDRFGFMSGRSQQLQQQSQRPQQQRLQTQRPQQPSLHNGHVNSSQLPGSVGNPDDSSLLPDRNGTSSAIRGGPDIETTSASTNGTSEHHQHGTYPHMRHYQYVTESGVPIDTGCETLTRCNAGGQSVLIPSEKLNPPNGKLEINGHSLPVTSQDVIISNGIVSLSPQLVRRIESSLQIRLSSINISQQWISDNNPQMTTDAGNERRTRLASWTRILSGLLLLAKTFYLLANNSIVPFFFVLELERIMSRKYTIFIAILLLLRTIWSTREVWDMWISYFDLNSIDEATYQKVRDHIVNERLTRIFYRDCQSYPLVIDIFMASNLREQRQQLRQNYTLEEFNEQNGAQSWHHFLNGVGQGTIRKEPLDDFLISCLRIYDESRAVMPHSYRESWKQLLKLGQRDLERVTSPQRLSRYRRSLRAFQWQVEVLRQSHFTMMMLEHVVPDPLEDNLISAIAKNITLFFLVFLPPIRRRVDTIIEERKRSREQQQRLHQLQYEERHQDDHSDQEEEELLEGEPGSSGVAYHNQDE